jgi:hypothetical protein
MKERRSRLWYQFVVGVRSAVFYRWKTPDPSSWTKNTKHLINSSDPRTRYHARELRL